MEHSISKIMLSGGVANLGNIAKFMTSEFRCRWRWPTRSVSLPGWSPPTAGDSSARGSVPKEMLPSLAVAAGLALRKLKDWE